MSSGLPYKNLSLLSIAKEEWRDIPGWEGRYSASSLGRIKSLPKKVTLFHGGLYHTLEKIIKQRKSNGYLFVALFDGKRRLDIQVHIIIGRTFIENKENKPFINHKNGIKDDNRVDQIEWCTAAENNQHAYDTGLAKGAMFGRKGLMSPSSKKVQCLFTGSIYCYKEAAKWLGISNTSFSDMMKGRYNNWTNFIIYGS